MSTQMSENSTNHINLEHLHTDAFQNGKGEFVKHFPKYRIEVLVKSRCLIRLINSRRWIIYCFLRKMHKLDNALGLYYELWMKFILNL